MNTIRKPRARPRLESINFRAIFWAIGFEASYMVYNAWKNGTTAPQVARSHYWRYHRVTFRHLTRKILDAFPRLRELP